MDFEAAIEQVIGKFTTDQAGTDQHHLLHIILFHRLAEIVVVEQVVDRADRRVAAEELRRARARLLQVRDQRLHRLRDRLGVHVVRERRRRLHVGVAVARLRVARGGGFGA